MLPTLLDFWRLNILYLSNKIGRRLCNIATSLPHSAIRFSSSERYIILRSHISNLKSVMILIFAFICEILIRLILHPPLYIYYLSGAL